MGAIGTAASAHPAHRVSLPFASTSGSASELDPGLVLPYMLGLAAGFAAVARERDLKFEPYGHPAGSLMIMSGPRRLAGWPVP